MVSLVTATGCYRWEATLAPTAARIIGEVRVTRLDGSMLTLGNARWTGDSVVNIGRGERDAVPRDSVRMLAVRRLDKPRTAALVVVVVGLYLFSLTAPPNNGGF